MNNQQKQQQSADNNEWAKHVNWGAYYLHRGIELEEEAKEPNKWSNRLKPSNILSGIKQDITALRKNALIVFLLVLFHIVVIYFFFLSDFDRSMLWLKIKKYWYILVP